MPQPKVIMGTHHLSRTILRGMLVLGVIAAMLTLPASAHALAPRSAFIAEEDENAKKDRILSGDVEPHFWLGGRDSALYGNLAPKAEIVLKPGRPVADQLRDWKKKRNLQDQDIVLILHVMVLPGLTTFRMTAGSLGELSKPSNTRYLTDGFAHEDFIKAKKTSPFLFENTFEIAHADSRNIHYPFLYVDPSLRSQASVAKLGMFQKGIWERYFDGYGITTGAGSLFTMWNFTDAFGADLDFETADSPATTHVTPMDEKLQVLVQVGLLEETEKEFLGQMMLNTKLKISERRFLYELLRIKWAALGDGNTLRGMAKRLLEVRAAIGEKQLDEMLLLKASPAIRGIIGAGHQMKVPSPPKNESLDTFKTFLSSRRLDGILSEKVEPNFWVGGRSAGIYRGLKIKGELKVGRGEDVSEKLSALKKRLRLADRDVVLLVYQDSHDIPPFASGRSCLVRVLAAPLGTFLETAKSYELGLPFSNSLSSDTDSFKHLFFGRNIKIESADKKIIAVNGTYLDPALRGRGWASELLAYQAEVFGQYCPRYTITTHAGHLYTAWTFLNYYDADLVLEDHGRSLSGKAWDSLVHLGVLSMAQLMRLQDRARHEGRGVYMRDVSRMLKKKWAPYGEGNALKGVLRHLQEVASKIGQDEVNVLLNRLGGLKIQGIVPGTPRSRNRYKDSLQQQIQQGKIIGVAA